MKFSPTTRSFYPEDLREDYLAAGTLPGDLLEMADAEYAALLSSQDAGKIIDWSGDMPVAIVPVVDPKIAIQGQIDQLERDSMTNRGARELQLAIMRQQGAANGLQTDEAIAAKVIYFAKLLALDMQIRALRSQL